MNTQSSKKRRFRKQGFDTKSLSFRLWLYFTFFTVLLMAVLWFLQIFFITTYYEEMKVSETNKIAHQILLLYGDPEFEDKLLSISSNNDMYIHIEARDGSIIFEPNTYGGKYASYLAYLSDLEIVKAELAQSSANSVAVKIPVSGTNYNILGYATYLDRSPKSAVVLYLFSPLYPVQSTIRILQNQLLYVTVISIFVALILSLFLSRRVSKPIKNINKTAHELAEGRYGIRFKGGHYTEIKDLADTLTYTSVELQKADAMQKDLLANVSHDIKTPLTMVKSYAEMIRDLSGNNPEKRNAHLAVIIEEADRLNVLVDDMMTVSKLQSGVITLEKTSFSIREATLSLIQTYDVLKSEGYSIEFECPEDIIVYADEIKIKQVISNLLTNAVKYCGDNKTIYVRATRKPSVLHFEIEDRGIGIAPADLENIWDRYYKASSNHTRNTNSSGLGLSIVKSILVLHNADFGVTSAVGKGSTFWFELSI